MSDLRMPAHLPAPLPHRLTAVLAATALASTLSAAIVPVPPIVIAPLAAIVWAATAMLWRTGRLTRSAVLIPGGLAAACLVAIGRFAAISIAEDGGSTMDRLGLHGAVTLAAGGAMCLHVLALCVRARRRRP